MKTSASRVVRDAERRVRQFAADAGLRAEATALLAVSGGADSLALLHMVARMRLWPTVAVAYVDHRLRSASEIAAEQEFVAEQAASLGVAFHPVGVPEVAAERPRSPEDAARRGRYAALADLAAVIGAAAVATGHTRSDQAETALLRLLRGSGVYGLRAMAPRSPWPLPRPDAPALLRPLLCLSRAETAAYCAALGLTLRTDAQNADPRFTRNRVRHELLPLLRTFNPRIEDALVNLADEAREIAESWAASLPPGRYVTDVPGNGVAVDADALRRLPSAAQIAVLREALKRAMPHGSLPSRGHLVSLQTLLHTRPGHRSDLPGGLWAWNAGHTIRIARRRFTWATRHDVLPVTVPGSTRYGPYRLHARRVSDVAACPPPTPWRAAISEAYAISLTLGPRAHGERIELTGMTGRKRVQDLLVDAKVPRDQRDDVPVVRSPRGVVWVVGHRVARWAADVPGPGVEVTVEPWPGAGGE